MKTERGVTLIELLIAVMLVSFLSLGVLMAMRVGLNAMDKSNKRLMENRRVASVEQILESEVNGLMPVNAECMGGGKETGKIVFFQGETQSMRFVSSYSLQGAARGQPQILEFQVIPREEGGVRLIVNEHIYAGPRSAGLFCLGLQGDPTVGLAPAFVPVQVGAGSFVLADKLQYCRFSFREKLTVADPGRWVMHWTRPIYPNAVRVEVAPLAPDPSHLQNATLTIPIHVNRDPVHDYVSDQ